MQANYSHQPSLSEPERDQPEDDFAHLEGRNSLSESAVTEVKFLSVMTHYEMEILKTLFPKCAETLAGVLRNRPQPFGEEL
jgi:hypothetical protein